MTSKQTVPDLQRHREKAESFQQAQQNQNRLLSELLTYASSILGWKILFMNPVERRGLSLHHVQVGTEVSRLCNLLIHSPYLLMVIWRGICLVDPLWPSTLHLHTQLRNKKTHNDLTKTRQNKLLCCALYMQVKGTLHAETLTSRWPVKLHHKLIEALEDGDLMLALDADSWLRKRQRQQKKKQNKQWQLWLGLLSEELLCFGMFYKEYLKKEYINAFMIRTFWWILKYKGIIKKYLANSAKLFCSYREWG